MGTRRNDGSVSQERSSAAGRAGSGGSWSLPVTEGAYALIPCWLGSTHWFDALLDALATPEGEAKRARAKVRATTLLAIANEYRKWADHATGRGVSVCHARLREAVGRKSNKTIQRATRLLEALGFLVTVVEGRYLTQTEREAAFQLHGHRQIKAGSVVALTLPPVDNPCAQNQNVHLPGTGEDLNNTPVNQVVKNQRASARRTGATRPTASNEQEPAKSGGSRRARTVWPAEMYGFAVELAKRLPWLTHRRHPTAVCAMLHRAGIDPAQWTPDALIRRVDAGVIRAGITRTLDGAKQRDPIAYTAWLIGQTIDPAAPTPAEEAQIIAARRAQRIAHADAERAAEAARIAAIDHEEVDRIIEQMHADAAAATQRTRRFEAPRRRPLSPGMGRR